MSYMKAVVVAVAHFGISCERALCQFAVGMMRGTSFVVFY